MDRYQQSYPTNDNHLNPKQGQAYLHNHLSSRSQDLYSMQEVLILQTGQWKNKTSPIHEGQEEHPPCKAHPKRSQLRTCMLKVLRSARDWMVIT